MPESLWWVATLSLAVGALLTAAAVAALWHRRPGRALRRLLLALALFAFGATAGAVVVGSRGYHALTHEEIAAVVRTEPLGAKRFRAHFRFPDGREQSFTLAGDELYVDARVLKWHAWVNFLGLHTAYELDRVSGRYTDLVEEQQDARTVYSLVPDRPVDLFDLRRQWWWFSPLVDAEYGSATFAAADVPAQYEVRISTSGLLIRRVEPRPS